MKLSQSSSVDSGDWIVLWKTDQGDYRGVSFADFVTALNTVIVTGRPEADVQYASPAATGFSVSILGTAGNHDVRLILTPVAGYAAGTLVLPPVAGLRDKQQVIVNCTQAVTTLTVSINGAVAANGAPTTLAANAKFKLEYDLLMKTWYAID